MKKLLSTGLSVAIAMSVCSTKTYAWSPTDFNDPKCIDLRNLRTQGKSSLRKITKSKNVCGCKTCTLGAITYYEINNYLRDFIKELNGMDEMITKDNQTAINWEAGKYGIINLVLLTDTVAAAFHPLVRGKGANLLGKVIYWGVMVGGSLVGLVCHGVQTHYEVIAIEDKMKLENTKDILEKIAEEINRKAYRNNNFLLVTTNYDPHSPSSTAFFAEKDDIFYNNDFYIDGEHFNEDEYFNEINERQLKPILARIKNGEFQTYKNYEYETKLRDNMVQGLYYTVPLAFFAEAYNAVRLNNPEALQKIKSFLKGKISKEKMKAFFREVKKLVDKGSFKKDDFLRLGVETVSIFVGEEEKQTETSKQEEKKQTETSKQKDL